MKKIIPFVILFALCFLLYRELYYSHPDELPSTLIGQRVPEFTLYDLTRPQVKFTQKNLGNGHVTLLNVWATWCYVCAQEHGMLMKIKNEYGIPIYSIDYKDNTDAAKKWLAQQGNPFVLTGNDFSGDAAIDLGVYGTPETFVISKDGKIIFRHIGAITQQSWDNVLYPLIKKWEAT